ncbi:MAG TPA: DUF370 domain-containing protein [Syntrophomonadaceae bacterium]|nr:DUF370 domain-containing protein [Syntrophomonadaceae bacterium]
MYLHIGNEMMIPLEELVMIIDMESGNQTEATEEYLVFASWDKQVVYVSSKINNRSIIITRDKVFYSPISTATLVKRARGTY